MPATVRLRLRTDCYNDGVLIPGYSEDIDLDQLTPRARTLAEAISQSPLKSPSDIWMEHNQPIKQHFPDWHQWFTPEQAALPDRRPWHGWSGFPADSPEPAVDWLERQARAIPVDWHVLGYRPHTPVPSLAAGAADRYLTRSDVVEYLRGHGRDIGTPSTWSGYVTRGDAPPPDRRVGRTPQWRVETIDAYLDGTWRNAEATR